MYVHNGYTYTCTCIYTYGYMCTIAIHVHVVMYTMYIHVHVHYFQLCFVLSEWVYLETKYYFIITFIFALNINLNQIQMC